MVTDDDISLSPGIINRNPELQSLKSYPWSRHAAWDLDSRCAVTRDTPALFKSGYWSKPSLVMCPLLFIFLFSFMLVY